MSKHIAVTGATGFVGRQLVQQLLNAGHAVRALSRRLDDPRLTQLETRAWDAAATTVDPSSLEGVDAICHLAAHLPASYADSQHAQQCLEINALGTLRLLDAAVAAGVPRFVHFSSGNVFRFQDRPVHEDDPIYPSSRAPYYLASKACGEVWASHFGESGKLSVCVLRPSSVYGRGMIGGVIPTFLDRLRAGSSIQVADGGRYQSDFVHVDDVAQAAVNAVLGQQPGSFNLGSGAPSTMLELAQSLVDLLGLPSDRIQVQPVVNAEPARGFAALDITRARSALDFHPRSLATGLRSMIDADPVGTL